MRRIRFSLSIHMIHPDVLQDAERQARAFGAAQPFRHVVIDGFLDPTVGRRLLDEFPSFSERHALNERGEIGGKAVRMDVRDVSDTYRAIDRYLQTREFLDYVSTVTGIPDLLYDPDYMGGGTHENRDGQGLDQHVDFNFHPGTRWHRRLNLIVYLNPEWDEAWGGNLQLQADPWNGDARGPSVAPLFNRAVIFETTERSWHGFDAIRLPEDRKNLSRKSFAIYLYTKERPVAETAASHATVYVPEGMPTGLKEGTTLTRANADDLRQRFERLRTQLKFLYDREKQFGEQIAAIEGALTQATDAIRMPIQGYATQDAPPRGLWPDGWVAMDLGFEFTLTRKSRKIELAMWAPRQVTSDQEFHITVDDKTWNPRVARGHRSTVTLDLVRAAGAKVAVRVRASQTFIPNRDGASTDDRALAWRLLGVVLEH